MPLTLCKTSIDYCLMRVTIESIPDSRTKAIRLLNHPSRRVWVYATVRRTNIARGQRLRLRQQPCKGHIGWMIAVGVVLVLLRPVHELCFGCMLLYWLLDCSWRDLRERSRLEKAHSVGYCGCANAHSSSTPRVRSGSCRTAGASDAPHESDVLTPWRLVHFANGQNSHIFTGAETAAETADRDPPTSLSHLLSCV